MDAYARELLTEETLAGIVALIPDDWLGLPAPAAAAEAHRRAYYETLAGRLDASAIFVAEALRARSGK